MIISINDIQHRRKHRTTTTTEPSLQDEVMNMLEADEIAEDENRDAEVTFENVGNELASKKQRLIEVDPCMNKHCGAGRICKVSFKIIVTQQSRYTISNMTTWNRYLILFNNL